MCAEDWPELVLSEDAASDQSGAGMPAKRGQQAEGTSRLLRNVSAFPKIASQSFVVAARGSGEDVAIAKHHTPNAPAILLSERAGTTFANSATDRVDGSLAGVAPFRLCPRVGEGIECGVVRS